MFVRRVAGQHPTHVSGALAAEVLTVGLAAVLAAVLTIRPDEASSDVLIGLLAFAMGLRSANVRHLGVRDMTTTVLTMTLTSLASDSRVAGGTGDGSPRKAAAVIAMLAGALAGALLVKSSLALPLAVAAGLALLTWLLYRSTAHRVQ
jgi:uncharacterized membrane protein YoaK (UPF0700 family)